MSQKRLRSDSVASTSSNWTIFAPSSAPDADGDIVPTNPHDTKHSRPSPSHSSALAITCFLPPSCAGTGFATHELFESHYAQAHTNRCLECGRNFPSGRFLELHIAEWHDPLSELKRERGEKGYGCFVEGCDRFCSTPQKRRLHVIDKHHFPREYNWGIVQWGIDNHTTLLTRPPRSTVASPASPTSPKTPTKPKKLGGKNPSPKQKDVNRKRPADTREEPTVEAQNAGKGGEQEEEKVEAENGRVGNVGGGREKMEVVKEVGMVDIEGAMSGLKLVPMSVRFGRKKGGR